MDEVVLFRLVGDNLEERSILVEKQIRVSVSQDAGAFRGKHEQLFASIGHHKCPDAVFSML